MDSVLENNAERPILDIALLRNAGLERISQLGNSIWTDYNASDPGVNILEVLCFSVLDLGFRTTFDIRDLLTPEGETHPRYEDAFHEAYEILPSAPLTIDDYRKMIIENVEGVKNVWLESTQKKSKCSVEALPEEVAVTGYYNVLVDINEDFNADKVKKTKEQIQSLLSRNRNLCEDFLPVEVMEHLMVGINVDLEVKPDQDYAALLKNIHRELREYISPDPKLYTVEELVARGKTVSDIFTGPLPSRGFVEMEEIEDLDNNQTLYASDIIRIIMQNDEVTGVRHLSFSFAFDARNKVIDDGYKVTLKPEYKRVESFRLSTKELKINLFVNGVRFSVQTSDEKVNAVKAEALKLAFDKDDSKNRKLDKFYSVQNGFPDIYMVGREGIADSESDLRKAQRLQLKGYLTFFDQLVADLQKRLNGARHVLTWEDPGKDIQTWKKRHIEYLHRVLNSSQIDDLGKLVDLDASNNDSYPSSYERMIMNTENELKRKNRALNHLLSRFNEDFVQYSIMQFISTMKERGSLEATNREAFEYELIGSKTQMLQNISKLGYRRMGAIDYTAELSLDRENYYALERKLNLRFGIRNYDPNRSLSPQKKRIEKGTKAVVFADNRKAKYTEAFGLHIIEHILLQPESIDDGNFLYFYKDETHSGYSQDPYSMRVTVAMPGWLDIVQDLEFRYLIERSISEEFPAHIAVRICWISPLQMWQLEADYAEYLKKRRGKKDTTESLKHFAQTLSQLKNMFQDAYTYIEPPRNQTLLGYTTLASQDYKWE